MERSLRSSRTAAAADTGPSSTTTSQGKRKREEPASAAGTPAQSRTTRRTRGAAKQEEQPETPQAGPSSSKAPPSRTTRSRAAANEPQPSAKALGKRRAISPEVEEDTEDVPESSARPQKRRKTDTSRSYNLRSRKAPEEGEAKKEQSSKKQNKMTKKSSRTKAKPILDEDDDVFAPGASGSHTGDMMDLDPVDAEDMDPEGVVVEEDEGSDVMEESEDEEEDVEPPATTEIHAGGSDGKGGGLNAADRAARDAQEAADALAAAAAAAADSEDAGFGSFAASLRAFPNILAGMSSRFKELLAGLRNRDDPNVRFMSLTDLCEVLAMSNEDTLAGPFRIEEFVRELVNILKGQGDMEGMDAGDLGFQEMILACRCLANLMEALPGSAHNVVHGGAVPILCAKLLEIQFIDLAEQTLMTLEKISEEMPGHIVREGGLTAILTYLDFFATNVQRTAVTTAANCCRSLGPDSFGMVRDIVPILRNVLAYSDQRVVEQACLAITRIVESYRHQPDKLEALLNAELLQAVCTLLVPGGGSVIGAATYTQLLRMLSTATRASPEVAMNLLEMSIVNTLYHLLVGVAAPLAGDETAGVQHQREEDDMLVLTNLVHRPKEQVLETLTLITELLPALPKDGVFGPRPPPSGKTSKSKVKREEQTPTLDTPDAPVASGSGAGNAADQPPASPAREGVKHESLSPGFGDFAGLSLGGASQRTAAMLREREAQAKKRLELIEGAGEERKAALRRFHLLMLPTLVDVYAASVGVQVRTKALLGMTKSIYFCPEDDLQLAVKGVPLASFLANLLATRDQNPLVSSGLQMVELLLTKLSDTYQFVFRREGVYHEVDRIAALELVAPPKERSSKKSSKSSETPSTVAAGQDAETGESLGTRADIVSAAAGRSPSNLTRAMQGLEGVSHESLGSPAPGLASAVSNAELYAKDQVTLRARWVRDKVFTADSPPAQKAEAELGAIIKLVRRFSEANEFSEAEAVLSEIAELFLRDDSPLTSFELLESGLLEGLLRFLSQPDQSDISIVDRQHLFFGVFSPSAKAAATPLSSLVKRLQDALSRIESFDVVTAFQSISDEGRRNGTSLLGRQLRITLKADGTEFPAKVRTIPVQVHAIATFQALHEYLKPRLLAALNEKPSESTSLPSAAGPSGLGGIGGARERLSRALADLQAATGTDGVRSSPRLSSSLNDLIPPEILARAASSIGDAASTSGQQERRRSSRLSAKAAAADPPQPKEEEEPHEPAAELDEDIDEDEDDEVMGAEEAIFEGEFDPPPPQDDKPVTVKVAADGAKMEAATPDGTRVGTPVLRGNAQAGPSSQPARPTASPAARPSYASALKSDAGDWHVEFTIGDQDIPLDATIYSSVHRYEAAHGSQISARGVWTNAYTVKFRKVAGPPSAIAQHGTPEPASRDDGSLLAVPDSIEPGSKQGHILQLLRVLHTLNADVPAELAAGVGAVTPLAEGFFINNKLTAKLSRQLEEPMIVASSCLPEWSLDLPQFYSFLFPFATRHSFLQSTSFGYARLLARWANTRPDTSANRRDEGLGYLGRLTRQKVRISRQRMLESAVKVFELYAGSRAALEVEYFDEVGTGLGPTLEFYASVSQEFQRKDLKLWRQGDNDSSRPSAFVHNPLGLFPAPIAEDDLSSDSSKKTLGLFKTLGQFIAQGLMDSRILDVPFNRHFMRLVLDSESVKPTLASLRAVDPALASSLAQLQAYVDTRAAIKANKSLSAKGKESKLAHLTVNGSTVEDLSLDFVLPGYPAIELKEDGQNKPVEGHNVEEYIKAVLDYTLARGIKAQLRAFREGFSTVFPVRDMRTFSPEELVLLFGNAEEDWSAGTLRETIRADHGLSSDSRAIRFLIEIMSTFDATQRRQFLQFITGSPKLPVGGFAALNPPLTVVRRGGANEVADPQLPSVMTCASYLKLPDYSSIEIMRERLALAMREGANSFHLS